jgi:hypothetical protein
MLQTMRIPRGLWTDLEETVIQQDRQFLSEVARSLGLPVQEVLRKCLGSGAPHAIPVTLDQDGLQCPWWTRTSDGCWCRCRRQRTGPTAPCHVHIHTIPGTHRLDTDPYLAGVTPLRPVRYRGSIYWFGPNHVYGEDGMILPNISIRIIKGQHVLVRD